MNTGWGGRRVVGAFVGVVLLSAGVSLSQQASMADSQPINLAISSSSEAGVELADLLLPELAGVPGLTMLERAALDKIAREQALAGSSSAALVKAGGLLGADGIVVLDAKTLTSRTWVTLRVIGVRHGVALGWWEYTIPKDETASWPKGAALQIKQLLPKLTSAASNSSPISFVGFSSPSSSRSATSLEREINSLFLKRLGVEPDLLVLERQKLLDAAFEKILSGDDRKFWNGGYLLEGTINPERIETETVTVRARLTLPGATAAEFTASGSRTKLSELAGRFVAEVRRALNAKPSSVAWDSDAEARRFYEQAEVAARWKFWSEAAAAADSALALGKDDLETRGVRLEAYTGLFKIDRRETVARPYKPRFGVLEHYTAAPPPTALKAALETAYQLLELAGLPNALATNSLRRSGTNAVDAVGRLLLKYYMGAELRSGHEEELRALREVMRELTEALLRMPERRGDFTPGLLKFGPLWYETPEEGLKLLQRIGFSSSAAFQAGLRPFSNAPDVDDFDWAPSLCGWKWSDRSRADDVWQSFTRARTPVPGQNLGQGPPTMQSVPEQALQKLSECVSNQEVPDTLLLHQLTFLTKASDRQRALELLTKVQSLPGLDKDRVRQAMVRSRIGFLSHTAPSQSTTGDRFSALQQPPALKPLNNTNICGFGGADFQEGRTLELMTSVLTLTNGQRSRPIRILWAEEKLWVFYEASGMKRWATETAGGSTLVTEYIIGAFGTNGCIETNRIPDQFLSFHERKDKIDLAVFPERILLFLEDQMLVFSRKEKTFASLPSPLKSPRVFFSGDRLFLCNEESLLETTDELKRFKVLAGVRRRPAVTPLDELPAYTKPGLVQAGGQLLFCLDDAVYAYRDEQWKRVPGVGRPISEGNGLTIPVSYWTNEVFIATPHGVYCHSTAPEPELWWGGVPNRVPGPGFTYRIVRDSSQPPPKFPLVPASAPFYFLQGQVSGFYRQAVFPFFGNLVTLSLAQNPKTPSLLQLWPTNSSQPITMHVSFPGLSGGGISSRLLLAGGSMFLWSTEDRTIWRVDRDALLSVVGKVISLQQKSVADIGQRLAVFLAPHDRNKNGKLDPEEHSALAEEPALFELVWSELDENHNNRIDGSEVRFFDFNRDRAVDETEHRAFLSAVSYYAASLYLFLDKNRDASLEEVETKDYCGAFLITVPGIFQKYDRSKSGKLDRQEWTELIFDLLDRRLSSRFEGLPPLPLNHRKEFLEPAIIARYFAVSFSMDK